MFLMRRSGGEREAAILHLDADAFFASVEQAADRRLRGRPVAVGGERRGVVASASYEARRMGIRTAMPVARARKLCPALVVVPGDFEKYERFSRFVFSYAYDFTPVVEVASIDEGYADLRGSRGVSAREAAEEIRRAVRQTLRITLSGGVGTNKLVAAVASKLRKPDALIEVAGGEEREFLAPLAARWLPGVGPKLAEDLRRAGLGTIGAVAGVPPEQLELFAGAAAPGIWRMAQGIDERPVVADPPEAKSLGEQETFEQDTAEEDWVRARLRGMADRLLARLRSEGRCARTVEVRIRYNDFEEARRSESFCEPTDLESDVYPAIDRLLRRAWERRVTLRLAGLKLSNLYGAAFQDTFDFFGGAGRLAEEAGVMGQASRGRRRALAEAVDRLREEHGPAAVLRGHDLFLRRGDAGRRDRRAVSRARGGPPCLLNVKSCYSFLDSLLTPEAAVRMAAEAGCEVVAITDPNLHGAVEFCRAAAEAGVRPVLGAELAIGGRRMLAWVKDRTGYRNLCALLSGGAAGAGLGDGAWEGLLLAPADALPEVRYAREEEAGMFAVLQGIRTLTMAGDRRAPVRRGAFHPRPWAETDLSRRVVEECGFALELGGLRFPRYHPPDGSSPRAFLERLAFAGLRARYGPAARRHEPQLREELAIVAEVGYEEYFLLVREILEDCRRDGIEWITRGSAADSLVCYCLGISGVCPIRYELYFKRFLNRDRMALAKLPDIDIDFAHDRRDDVVDRIFARHGVHAAVVGGFSTYQGRSAFADIAKVFGVSERQIRRFTAHLPRVSAAGMPEAVARMRECAGLDFGEDPYATALRLAARLDGFPRHPKMHPCGVVLSREPVAEVCPLFTSASGRPTTHFDMDAVEAAGLVKIDILAQGGLAVMRDAVASIRAEQGAGFRIPDDDFSDRSVWEMIASGGARGVHHIESPAMTSLNRMVKVGKIDDLIAIVSVIRPGAANTMRKASFARRAQGLEPVEYAHPSLEPVLRSTYGVVAYEEHVLQICEAFAGMPAGRADILRRALVKGHAEKAAGFFEEFAGHARRAGRSGAEIARVWELLMGFRGYAFCRAHSTAYGVEAYQAAWLKRYHPAHFLAAVLTHGKGFYDRLTYSIECRRLGIGFLPPDVNLSRDGYAVEAPDRIRVPLRQVKGLRDITLERWRDARPFASMREFVDRIRPDADELDALVRVGAFDSLGGDRVGQFWEARSLLRRGAEEMPLFGEVRETFRPPAAEEDRLGRLRDESALLGFTVSGHPLEMFPDVAWETYCPIAELMNHPGRRVTIAGMIVADRHHDQSDGRPMKFLTLCDPTGLAECELFADAYARFGSQTVRHPVLAAEAVVRPFDNGNGCTLEVLALRAARRRG